jgi:hypothetical protein
MPDPIGEFREQMRRVVERGYAVEEAQRQRVLDPQSEGLSGPGGTPLSSQLVRSGGTGFNGVTTTLPFSADLSLINTGTLLSDDIVYP